MTKPRRAGDRLRVLHLIDDLQIGGAQRVAIDIANRLDHERGTEVMMAAEPGAMRDQLAQSASYVEMPPPGDSRRYLHRLLELMRRFQPDIIHAHQRRVALYANVLSRVRPVAVVEHVHTDLPAYDQRLVSYRSDALVAVGESVARMLTDSYRRPRRKVFTLQNCVVDRFGEMNPQLPPADRSGSVKLLAVGRLTEQKNPHRFCELVATVKRLGVRCEGRWIGDGPLAEEVAAHATELGVRHNVAFVGADMDVAKHLRWCTLLVHLSAWEGLPLVILEAMSAGRPVVAHDVGSVRDAVDGSCGWLFPPDTSVEVIAHRLVEAIRNPGELATLGAQARRTYAERFSPAVYFERLRDIYGFALTRSRS